MEFAPSVVLRSLGGFKCVDSSVLVIYYKLCYYSVWEIFRQVVTRTIFYSSNRYILFIRRGVDIFDNKRESKRATEKIFDFI
ncbi:hypothetical protein DRJ48_04970 [Candidatus Woesearchaeota archaeon]|nr:MAG: hypothetical protein DRJ48_04970 [Candidatus Woesearchaeota archaeon]